MDQTRTWARWKNASDLKELVDSEIQIPADALCKFKDKEGHVAVIEEAIVFLTHPFHEVRMCTVSIVAGLFGLPDQHWRKSMFHRLTVVLHDLFIVKVILSLLFLHKII